MKRTSLIVLSLTLALFLACGGGNRRTRFIKNPTDTIIRDMPDGRVFTILLYDMNVEGNFVENFYHQYRIIQEKEPGVPTDSITDWMEVSESYFKQHQDDMGMELASRGEDGQLNKTVGPPGYSNYVGNEKYGSWQQDSNGNSFWAFYGKFAFMNAMFNMMTYPARRSYYDDYRGNYYGRGRAYYGPGFRDAGTMARTVITIAVHAVALPGVRTARISKPRKQQGSALLHQFIANITLFFEIPGLQLEITRRRVR